MNINNKDLGELSIYRTEDGSISLHSSSYQERFHCASGALKEAQEKFLLPAHIEHFTSENRINILDVCVGMGYNSGCIIQELVNNSIEFDWWGLEIDQRPIKISLNDPGFKSLWSIEVQDILTSIKNKGNWNNKLNQGQILWGDAREKISHIPLDKNFDLILHDPFSPIKCPKLWTEEFISNLAKKLSLGGILITYSTAAAIRGSMRRSGLKLASQIPIKNSKRKWSNGTIGILTSSTLSKPKYDNCWSSLTLREEEHLLTKASVPYRDPSGFSTDESILQHRLKEQKNSKLEPTSNWKTRWEETEQSQTSRFHAR